MAADPSFPAEALAEAARIYAGEHNLFALAEQCGARKKGYRMQSLGVEKVADLLGERLAGHPAVRKPVLTLMLKDLGGAPEALAGEDPAALRARLRAMPMADAATRARWILALLQDPRPELWPLVRALRRPRRRAPATELKGENPAGAKARPAPQADPARAEVEALRFERDRLAREVDRLNREVARHVERRRREEDAAAKARRAAEKSAAEAAQAKAEIRRLSGRAAQVSDGAALARELRDRQNRIHEQAEQYARLLLDYSAVKGALRSLKDRMADYWTEGKLQPKDLRSAAEGEPFQLEPPLEKDTQSAAEKVRMPSDPHHWPGGAARFRAFLGRIAGCEHVTRIMPRTFEQPTRHGISMVTEEGDLVARVSEGDHSALVLILTTATHRGQGEFVKRQLEPLFAQKRL